MLRLKLTLAAATLAIGSAAFCQTPQGMAPAAGSAYVKEIQSLDVEMVPALAITAELTDKDCPAGTVLYFDANNMDEAQCLDRYGQPLGEMVNVSF